MKDLGIGSRVKHPSYGEGVVCAVRYRNYKISFVSRGTEEIDKDLEGLEVIEAVHEEGSVQITDVKEMLTDILYKWSDVNEVIQMGDRWNKGKLVLQPYSNEIAPKEIPIENFFHKIVMLRDRLRVMEQKINAHKVMTDEEKIEMQQYITRIYGSLTTFNVLFKYKEDFFVGQKGE